jgi:acyl-coenzyme A thioesterase PaaI-like protein
LKDSNWAGGDFQEPPRTDGGVALCGGCSRTGECRLGLTTERLDADGSASFEITCPADHEGGPGVAHGGWTAAVLDEVCGHVPILHGQLSVTGTLTTRFVKPVPVGRRLVARAWIVEKHERKWRIAGELTLASSGALLAEAEGTFVLRDRADHFGGFERWLAEQDGDAGAENEKR